MSAAFARRLLRTRALLPADVGSALLDAVSTQRAFVRVLVERYPDLTPLLERELARLGGTLVRSLRPRPELAELLPPGACERLFVVPHRGDARAGTLEFATAYPADRFLKEELEYQLKRRVQLVRAPIRDLLTALEHPAYRPGAPLSEPPVARTPAFGTPAARRLEVSRPPLLAAPRKESAGEESAGEESAREESAREESAREDVAPESDGEAAIPLMRRASMPPPPAPGQPQEPAASGFGEQPHTTPGVGAPELATFRSVTSDDPTLGLTRQKPVGGQDDPERALRRVLRQITAADDSEHVVSLLTDALSGWARRVVVFTVQSKGYRGRHARGCGRFDPRQLFLLNEEAVPLRRAVDEGHYLGTCSEPMPGLEAVIAEDAQVYAVPIRVGERAVLVSLLVELRDDYASSRSADRLSATASATLERLLMERKGSG